MTIAKSDISKNQRTENCPDDRRLYSLAFALNQTVESRQLDIDRPICWDFGFRKRIKNFSEWNIFFFFDNSKNQWTDIRIGEFFIYPSLHQHKGEIVSVEFNLKYNCSSSFGQKCRCWPHQVV